MNQIQTILIDSREKRPLIFPKSVTIKTKGKRMGFELRTETATLDAGDYCLAEFPKVGGCERKAGQRELYENLLSRDKSRFHKAFDRFLETYSHPFLLIEQNPLTFIERWRNQAKYIGSYDTFDALMTLSIRKPVPILWAETTATNTRRKLGGLVARTLILAAKEHTQ
jgi:ERCC4-type nuclease